jgi:cytochrome c biogenesis protein CcmG/thiol:disulfide interchange protein DsbE
MALEPNTNSPDAQPTARSIPNWVILLAFLALIGFLAIIALQLRRSQQGPIVIGQTVPPIQLTTFDGKTITTTDAELKGKVIVLNFWASWCTPCESEAADLQQAWLHYQPGGKVVFLGIDYVDTEPEAKAYLEKFSITYPNGPDLGTRASQAFRILGVPETYIIDQNGKLVYKEIGPFQSLQEILAVINPLLE